MNQYTVFAIAMAAFLLLFWLIQRPAGGNRRPGTLVLALLRPAGPCLRALGEAVEIVFFHARQVRDRLNLDLDQNDSGGEL